MLARLLQNLSIYLGDEYKQDLMTLLVNQVIARVKFYRNYPDSYTSAMIDADIEKYEPKIFDIVLKVYNRMGVEGEKIHDENLTKSTFVEEEKFYDFIIPIARCV